MPWKYQNSGKNMTSEKIEDLFHGFTQALKDWFLKIQAAEIRFIVDETETDNGH